LITQAETLESFEHLRADLPGIGIGSYVVELVDAVTYEEGSNLKLYDLLLATLKALDSGRDPAVILHYFELHLLGLSGFRPELFMCVECGKQIIEQDQYLSGQLGGAVCPSCLKRAAGADIKPVSARTLKYLRHFQRSSMEDLIRLELPEDIREDLEDAIRYYLNHTLEGPLNSPNFIQRLNN
jgi:DNA repair protein RecO (recombination protein O)